MRINNFVCGMILGLFLLGFYPLTADQNPQKKETGKPSSQSLIRKDLLNQEKKKLGPPRRNIFSLRRTRNQEGGTTALDPELKRPGDAGAGPEQVEIDPVAVINMQYIGYIRSEEKIVALIILQGEPMAIAEGEILLENIEILKITAEEIEYTGPDSKTRKVSIEGEDR